MIADDRAWAAVKRRDRAFDGQFVTGVISTGIYCRPSCAARHPSRANVAFFADGPAAQKAGLRACLRCRPDDVARDSAAILQAIATIKSCQTRPALAALANAAGYSSSHFQRIFSHHTGMSPAAYYRALRQERAIEALSAGTSVTDAIFNAGFENSSRFYGEMEGKLGMAPSVWVKGGRGISICWAIAQTSYGPMLVAASPKGICRLSFNEGPEQLARRFPEADRVEGGEQFSALLEQVIQAVENPAAGVQIPLDVQGTAFQQAIWAALQKIPPGQTLSYSQLAANAGHRAAVRAAGSANGANPVAVLIPCHRVIRSDGGTGGYAYGEKIKRALLDREAGKNG